MATETLMIFNDDRIGDQFSSFSPEDFEGKVKLYNAINSPDVRIADVINMPITMRDVVITKVKLSEKIGDDNDKTGENPFVAMESDKREGFRVIIIDTEGKSYTATSAGIYNSVCTLRSVFGTLHFEQGLKVVVKQIKTKNGNTLSLAISQ